MRKTTFYILLVSIALIALPTVALALNDETPTKMERPINKTLTLAATEYSVAIGPGIKAFFIQLRGSYDLRVSTIPSGTSSAYFTIKSGTIYISPSCFTTTTFYFRCDGAAGQVVEIEYWR